MLFQTMRGKQVLLLLILCCSYGGGTIQLRAESEPTLAGFQLVCELSSGAITGGVAFLNPQGINIGACNVLHVCGSLVSNTVSQNLSISSTFITIIDTNIVNESSVKGEWKCTHSGETATLEVTHLLCNSSLEIKSVNKEYLKTGDQVEFTHNCVCPNAAYIIEYIPENYQNETGVSLSIPESAIELTYDEALPSCRNNGSQTITGKFIVGNNRPSTTSRIKITAQIVGALTSNRPTAVSDFKVEGETTTNSPTTTEIPETTSLESSTATTEVTSTLESTSSTAVPSSASTVVTTVTGTSQSPTTGNPTTTVTSTSGLTKKEKIIIIAASGGGGFLLILTIILVIFCCMRKSRTSQNLNQNSHEPKQHREKPGKRTEQQRAAKNGQGDRYQTKMKQENVYHVISDQRGYQHGYGQHYHDQAYQTPQQPRDHKAAKNYPSRQTEHLYPQLDPHMAHYYDTNGSYRSYHNPSYTGPHAIRDGRGINPNHKSSRSSHPEYRDGHRIKPDHKSSKSSHPEYRDQHQANYYEPDYDANWDKSLD